MSWSSQKDDLVRKVSVSKGVFELLFLTHEDRCHAAESSSDECFDILNSRDCCRSLDCRLTALVAHSSAPVRSTVFAAVLTMVGVSEQEVCPCWSG